MRTPQQALGSPAGQTLRGLHRSVRLRCCQPEVTRSRVCDLTVRAVTTHAATRTAGVTSEVCDLVLSSGFLAFAGHAGFLQAVEEAGLLVGGVMGTSAGALVGSLYCAGYTPQQVAKHLSEHTPASLLRPSGAPWRGGALSLDGVIDRLRDLLPPRFEDLRREFAVGVVTADGRHLLIDSGPLPEAVAASAAIPFVFQAVDVPGHAARHGPFKDGGVVDRVGLKAWRDRRRAQILSRPGNGVGRAPAVAANGSSASARPPPCLVHVIDRSSPFSGLDDTSATGESRILVVKSPRSGANFFDLGSFEDHMRAATERARPHLVAVRTWGPTLASGSASPSSSAASSAAPAPAVNGHVGAATASSSRSNGAVAVSVLYNVNGNGNGYGNGNGSGYSNGSNGNGVVNGVSKAASSNGNGSGHVNGNGNGVPVERRDAPPAATAAAGRSSPPAAAKGASLL